jgi:hypothetical protein
MATMNRGADGLCGSEDRMRHVRPEVLVSGPTGVTSYTKVDDTRNQHPLCKRARPILIPRSTST